MAESLSVERERRSQMPDSLGLEHSQPGGRGLGSLHLSACRFGERRPPATSACGLSAVRYRLPRANPMPRSHPHPSRDPRRRMTAVELFCGVGGMALGFEQAGFDVLAAVDLDPVHLAAHTRNFPLSEPVCEDISTIHGKDLLGAARKGWTRRRRDAKFAGPVECVFGGPSCQGFSVIGRRDPRIRATRSLPSSPE